jgi:AraC family transcriptional activator of mar-sox-rob regulon
LRLRKLLEATHRLDSGETVLRAAITVGYESPSAFNLAFRRHFGMSPGDFRAGGRKDGGYNSPGRRNP